eukprot:TCALIF_01195-PA protein Name:"Similar to CG6621 Tetratricopeptide repeat protein 14 homolog (Drosophila melanogaster)" AED:0.04 eAED:0.04 QI:0/0.33/0.25/0.75/1/1/4/31/1055
MAESHSIITPSQLIMDPQLLKASLNYHGQPLAQSLQQSLSGLALDLTEASHEQYMARSRSFRLEDRGQRLALQRFIVHAAPRLFKRVAGPTSPAAPVDSDVIFPISHSLERFVPQPTVEGREKSFFQRLAPGDPMFARVSYRNPSGLLLALLGFHPVSPDKPTFTGDLALRSICPMKEALPLDPSDKPYALGDMMIVAVVEASPDSKRVLVSMMESSLNPKYRAQIRLGRINAVEVPTEVVNPPEPVRYDEALKQSSSFLNPSSVNEMAAALGLPIHGGSLCSTLKRVIPETELASGVRKRQNANWAFNHVASGIRHFNAGNNIEAFQCLNQALKIDAKNVEGLVARGALYANNGSLDRAVQDFEEALEVNPTHKNANKYIAETLVALGRNYEESGDVPKALESYDKILKFVPDHKEAMDSIVYLSAKATSSQAPIDVPSVKTTDDLDLQLPPSLGLIRDSGRRNRSCSSSLSPTRGPHPIRDLHPMSVPPPVGPTASMEVPLFPTPSSSTAMLSHMNFSVPPPGMIPFSGPSALDKDYEKRVQAFLSKTMTKENQKSRSRSRDKSSRKRSKSRDRRRRSGSREKRSRKRSRSRNRDRSRDRHRRKRSSSVGSSRDRSRREKESPSNGRVSSKSSKSRASSRHGRLPSQERSKKELRALVKRTPSPELNSIAERIKSQARALLGEDQGGEDIASKLNTFLTEDKQTSKQEEMSHVGKVAVPTFDRKRASSPGVKAAFDVPGTPSNSSAQTRMSMKSSALPAQSWIGGKREQEIRIRLERSPVKRVVDRGNSPSKSSIDSRYESKEIHVREVDRPDHHRDPRERSPVVERRVVRHVEPSPPPKDHALHYEHRQRRERYGRRVDSISDLRSETLNIQLEREIIEKERAALLLAAQQYAQSRSPSMPSVDSPSPLRDLSRLSPQAIVDQARSRRRFGDSRSQSSERPKNGDSSRSRRRRERTRSRSRSGDRGRSRKARTFTSQPEESPKAGCSQWKTDYDYMDNVLSSVSSAVNLPEKEIIPGKNTFEEIEDFLSQAKRERKEKMSKSFQKTPTSSRR